MKEIFDSSLREDTSVLAGNRSLNKDYALYIEGLTVSFDGFKAVDNLSLYVDEGEIRVIIGPNGAGKTTVLDMICGKTKATSGSIKFHDKELTKLKEYEIVEAGVGRKFQNPSIYEALTVFENLELSYPKGKKVWGALLFKRNILNKFYIALEKRLLNMNIHSIYDLAHTSPKRLQKNFGKMGLLLFEHANGIDNTIIKNIKTPTQKSLGHSQVLYKDYYNEECLLIIKEMLGHLTEKLRLKNLECQNITLFCSYSKALGGGFSHSLLLDEKTDNEEILFLNFKALFDRYYEMDMPVRKIGLHIGRLESKKGVQLDLFYERKLNDEKLMKTLDIIHQKFGKNSLLYATSLLSYSTEKEQNQKLGGHHV